VTFRATKRLHSARNVYALWSDLFRAFGDATVGSVVTVPFQDRDLFVGGVPMSFWAARTRANRLSRRVDSVCHPGGIAPRSLRHRSKRIEPRRIGFSLDPWYGSARDLKRAHPTEGKKARQRNREIRQWFRKCCLQGVANSWFRDSPIVKTRATTTANRRTTSSSYGDRPRAMNP
jgi:hypothetical protein